MWFDVKFENDNQNFLELKSSTLLSIAHDFFGRRGKFCKKDLKMTEIP